MQLEGSVNNSKIGDDNMENNSLISTVLLVSTFVTIIFWTLTLNGGFDDLGIHENNFFPWVLCFALFILMYRVMRNPQKYEEKGVLIYIIVFIVINFFALTNMKSNKLILVVIDAAILILGKMSRVYYIKTDKFESENKKLIEDLEKQKAKILDSKSLVDIGYELLNNNSEEECYVTYDNDNYPQNIITIYKSNGSVDACLYKREKFTNEENTAVYKRLIELGLYNLTGNLVEMSPPINVTKNTGKYKVENEKWQAYHDDLISRGMKLYRVSFANHKKYYGGNITPRYYVEAIDKDASIVEARKRAPEYIKHQSITECVVIAGAKNMKYNEVANKWIERHHLGYNSIV